MTEQELSAGLKCCAILAHGDPTFAGRAGRCLVRRGWEVYAAGSAAEVRRLIRRFRPAVVALDTELADESGWLVCGKLTQMANPPRVLLVTSRRTPEGVRFARFVGAAGLVRADDGPAALVGAMLKLCPAAVA